MGSLPRDASSKRDSRIDLLETLNLNTPTPFLNSSLVSPLYKAIGEKATACFSAWALTTYSTYTSVLCLYALLLCLSRLSFLSYVAEYLLRPSCGEALVTAHQLLQAELLASLFFCLSIFLHLVRAPVDYWCLERSSSRHHILRAVITSCSLHL